MIKVCPVLPAGARLAELAVMVARLAPLLFFACVLITGCKSMGGLGSGLGHIAGDVGHVAGEVGHVAGDVGRVTETLSHAAPVVAHVAGKTLPIAEDVLEAAALSPHVEVIEQPGQAPQSTFNGPLIGSPDPCEQCPEDVDCSACVGNGDVTCRLTPPGAYARCESPTP